MAVTREEVLKIADLAKLHFSESEIDAFVSQFQRILEYIEQLKEVDIQGVEPTSHVSLTKDLEKYVSRDDEVCASLSMEKSLSGAPDAGSGYFRVPKVI